NNSILVGVADTGSGIAYKKQKTIFQLDDKLHATLSEGGMTSDWDSFCAVNLSKNTMERFG
ncbi:MAG: hypothetical protein OEZ34_15265, partial [Spirochaetia bacterium]|nr:hypothetical protein [Spirochaetia bacterium]